jgi:hypothetical protein
MVHQIVSGTPPSLSQKEPRYPAGRFLAHCTVKAEPQTAEAARA